MTEPTLPQPVPEEIQQPVVEEQQVQNPATEPQVEPKHALPELTGEEEQDELEVLIDPLLPFTLSNGLQVRVRQLNLREFLVMMRILTRGTAITMGNMSFNPNDPNFARDIVALFIFALAESEYEAVEFIKVMLDPVDTSEEGIQKFDMTLDNPDLDDTIVIIEYIVAKAAPNMKALGKRLASLMKLAQKVGAI